jgi:rubrerythrin
MNARLVIIAAAAAAALTAGSVAQGQTAAGTKLQKQTSDDLTAAMQDEAYTVLKYRAYAERARAEGKKELADLFDQTSQMEQNHFEVLMKASGHDSPSKLSVADVVVSEYANTKAIYAKWAERAEAAGDKEIAKIFRQLDAEEGTHYKAFREKLTGAVSPAKP